MDLDAVFVPLANAAGASVDQIKLISCLLLAYPLGSIFVRIPASQPALKHVYSIAITLFFFFPVLKIYGAFFQLLASVMATYAVAKFDHSWRMPWIVFAIVMGHLTINHIIRALKDTTYDTMDVSGPQMVLTMKLTTFAWNVWDGRRPTQDLDKWQATKRVVQFPTLLEFLGYAFYFPGILVGPYLEFHDYMELITERLFDTVPTKGNVSRKLPTGRKRVAYRKMLTGLAFLAAFVLIATKHNYTVALQPWFKARPFWYRLAFFQLFGPMERLKYYAVWTLTEGASIITGFGFTGFDASGRSKWEGAANVIPIDIELPSNFKGILDSWNMKTNVWLRECVYKRVTPHGKKPGFASSMITSMTSAFWHGMSPGYYLTFMLGGFITATARLVRANFRPFFLPAEGQSTTLAKRLYDISGTVVSIIILNYATVPFVLLTINESLEAWRSLSYYGHLIIGGGMVFFYAGGAKYCKGLQKKKGILPQPRKAAPPSESGSDSVGPATPVAEKDFMLPPSFDKIVPPPQK